MGFEWGDCPFVAGADLIWALWFIDDGLLCFTGMSQLRRLFPQLRVALTEIGLDINISKSKILSNSLPSRLPSCLDGIQVVRQTVFLGLPLAIQEHDEDAAQSLLRRAVQAFFSNRRILIARHAPLDRRLYMFNSLITSTIRWALGTVLPTANNLRAMRVQCTTLLVWILRLRQHTSWQDTKQFSMICHIAKLWGRCCWGGLWDVLLLRCHWMLAGHMLRSNFPFVLSFCTGG